MIVFQEIQAAEAFRQPPTGQRTAASALEAKTVERIADDMLDIAAGKGADGACEEVDLLRRGWTPEALAEHGAAANRLALGRAGNAR